MSHAIEKLATQLGHQLKQKKFRLATVESCTGGGLSYWITSVAGSSTWFERGFVTYTGQAKIDLVGVKSQTLATHGEVSEATAKEMAEGGLQHSTADICIAITGIAGPDGGSEQKPVGTVWIAWAFRLQPTIVEAYYFAGDRQNIRMQSMEAALSKLLELV